MTSRHDYNTGWDLSREYDRAYRRFFLWAELPNLFDLLAWPLCGGAALSVFWEIMTKCRMERLALAAAIAISGLFGLRLLSMACKAMSKRSMARLRRIADTGLDFKTGEDHGT